MRLLAYLAAISLACAIGLGLGGWTAWRALTLDFFVDKIDLDEWSAFTELSDPGNNPYAAAKAAQLGGLPLGLAEGFTLSATTDALGQRLRAGCNYTLSGSIPQARLWTLDAVGLQGDSLLAAQAPQTAIHSRAVVHTHRDENSNADVDAIVIGVGPDPVSGNWMRVEGDRPMTLILRLYDTQVGSGVGVREVALPRILPGRARTGC
ncbi:MAG: DUF1214 domain-containing protein [Pseudomonadota bacterium]